MIRLTDPWGDIVYVRKDSIIACSAKLTPCVSLGIGKDYREVTLINGPVVIVEDSADNMTAIMDDLQKP